MRQGGMSEPIMPCGGFENFFLLFFFFASYCFDVMARGPGRLYESS